MFRNGAEFCRSREDRQLMTELAQASLVALSQWIDAGNAHRDREAVAWGRLAKIAEENGEVIEAFIGATGQNPRKGVTCSIEKVLDELLDVAITALAAYEHLDGHEGRSLGELDYKIRRVAERAGVLVPASPDSGEGDR